MRPNHGWWPELEGGSLGRRASASRSEGVVEIDRLDRGVARLEDTGVVIGDEVRGVDGRECVGVGGFDADSPSNPKMPGSRCPNGLIALNI